MVVYCWGPGCNAATKACAKIAGSAARVKEMLGGFEYYVREGYPVEGEQAHRHDKDQSGLVVLPGRRLPGAASRASASRPPRRLWRRPSEHGDARGARPVGPAAGSRTRCGKFPSVGGARPRRSSRVAATGNRRSPTTAAGCSAALGRRRRAGRRRRGLAPVRRGRGPGRAVPGPSATSNSCNGTLLNGRLVRRARLRRGDVLVLGETVVRVR